MKALLDDASAAVGGHKFSISFLIAEWEQIVDAWQLEGWEAYRDVARLGRKTRLPEAQRATLWAIFDRVRKALAERGLKTAAGVFQSLAAALASSHRPPYDFRGRSRTLRVNYRTSHQIRQQADCLLGPEVSDVDGNRETRRDAISVFNGPPPVVRTFATEQEEIAAVSTWLTDQLASGVRPHEIGIFSRSTSELPSAQAAADRAGLPYRILDDRWRIWVPETHGITMPKFMPTPPQFQPISVFERRCPLRPSAAESDRRDARQHELRAHGATVSSLTSGRPSPVGSPESRRQLGPAEAGPCMSP